MSVEVRSFDSLGAFQLDWLNAKHHFSFGHYHDPERMGVGPLRVWNDDAIQPRTGFDPHPHRDMEIITYVREGAITHKDSLGNTGRTEAGDIQVMSAGSGIVHAEYNLEDDPTRLFQIWIMPRGKGGAPRWETRHFPKAGDNGGGGLKPLASGRKGVGDVAPIDQDATLFAGMVPAGTAIDHPLGRDRQAYLVAARGRLIVDGVPADTRDGILVRDTETIRLEAPSEGGEDAEVILVDLPL
ncbi:pirin family protein [Marivibrio halodurans]|uniref:Pirin family protein n=1 Tax=Marivibrio halodurans TaxID=2039722 RepID=A0A8J7SLZ1_9PROT|nr:pirin-like bicupin family protein [Marivibrio halodurans]MBP5856581.1 pirin family protein [Marivibrio halodurans]